MGDDMKLYRIKNKHTGKFLTSSSMYRKPQWTATGVFYRKIDTIKKHAEAICTEWGFEKSSNYKWRFVEKSYYPERMDDLVIVINDVTINGEEEIEATKIFKK